MENPLWQIIIDGNKCWYLWKCVLQPSLLKILAQSCTSASHSVLQLAPKLIVVFWAPYEEKDFFFHLFWDK
jgi:hypothetical protein